MKAKLSILFFLLALAVVVLTFNWQKIRPNSEDSLAADGESIRAVSLEDLNNVLSRTNLLNYSSREIQINLSQLATDKTVFIHLWASWCGPCLNEIPELIAYAHKNLKSTQFILVSLDSNSEELQKFLRSFPEMATPNFIQVWDRDSVIAKRLNADRLPMTVVIEKGFSKIKEIRSVVDWKQVPGI